ncbi:MAG TPA: uroporphyrinogen decarboxylase family protein [Phycisphaerae bacterium]|nr:uroporphyrinogen decarboxylase family protein [Phycisphaerae bacterium]
MTREMTPREIILANIENTGAPRCGLTFSGKRIDDMIGGGAGPSKTYTPRRWQEGKKEYYDDEWGNLWVRMVGGSVKGEILEPVLKDWKQLDDFTPPDYSDPDRWANMRKYFAQPTDRFKLAHIGGWIFDNARYLRKMEIYFTDMVEFPEELHRLHAMVAGVFEAKIHAAGQAQADGIMIGEDMGTQNGLLFSPAMWREYFKDLYTRLFGLAHEYGMKVLMHSCGYNWEILDDLLDAGVDVFQFDQPARYDMLALAAKLRSRKAALWAPVDIQKVLPTGDRKLIESEARRMVETFRGCLICKNYPDLPGIGVREEWDRWAYEAILRATGVC